MQMLQGAARSEPHAAAPCCSKRPKTAQMSGVKGFPGQKKSTGSFSWGWPSLAKGIGGASAAILLSPAHPHRWGGCASMGQAQHWQLEPYTCGQQTSSA